MTQPPPDPLQRALEQLGGRSPALEGALASLLEAWAELRAPALSQLIERLSATTSPSLDPIGAQSPRAYHDEWLERAGKGRPADLAVLLPSVASTTSKLAIVRLRAIEHLLPDPRFVSTALELIRSPPYAGSTTGKFWTQLYRLLVICADPRAIEALEAIPAVDPEDYRLSTMARRLDRSRQLNIERMRRALADPGIELVPTPPRQRLLLQLEQRIQALERASKDAAARERELLDAVLEQPHEFGYRHVYADFLLARGDPRGEFIALQLANSTKKSARARAKELLETHGHAWLGELGPALTVADTRFVAGFLHTARVKLSVEGALLERIVDHPLWATVVSLANAPLPVLASPVMRALEVLRLDDPLSAQLLRSSHKLPQVRRFELELRPSYRNLLAGYRAGFNGRYLEALARLRQLPSVEQLYIDSQIEIDSEHLDWLWNAPMLSRLRSFELRQPASSEFLPVHCYEQVRTLPCALERIELRQGPALYRFIRAPGSDPARGWQRVEFRSPDLPPYLRAQLDELGHSGELECVASEASG